MQPRFDVPPRMLRGAAQALVLALCLIAAVPAAALALPRHVSPGGSDAGNCTSAPCRSFGYAYRQAAPGDTVEVAPGQYPDQSIPSVGGRSGPPVDIRPTGPGVVVDELNITGSQVIVRGVTAGSIDVSGASNVTVANSHARTMSLNNVQGVQVLGGSYGGNRDAPTVSISASPASRNIVFDGVDFHDAVATNSTVHMECIWAGGVQGFVVRNSIFRNCAYFDIFFTRLNGPDPRDVLLESNVFESPKQWNGQNAPYSVNIANWVNQAVNYTIRNNTFGGDIAIQPTSLQNVRLVGNLGAIASCTRGVSYAYNVFTKARCSGTDKQVAGAMSQFVNPGGHDWRLKPGAAAIDAANPADAPATDREGLLRNGLPDAGAHEYGGIRPGPGTNPSPERRLRKRRKVLARASLSRRVICKRKRRCPRSTRLRVVLRRKRAIVVRVRPVGRRRGRVAKTLRFRGKQGTNVRRITSRGLKRGRYRVVVKAKRSRGSKRALKLRVR